MIAPTQLESIRSAVIAHLGQRVRFTARTGRRKTNSCEGILEKAYGNVFIVQTLSGDAPIRLSFSYGDLLTHTVRLYNTYDGQHLFATS